jgi:hypothetical protein
MTIQFIAILKQWWKYDSLAMLSLPLATSNIITETHVITLSIKTNTRRKMGALAFEHISQHLLIVEESAVRCHHRNSKQELVFRYWHSCQ